MTSEDRVYTGTDNLEVMTEAVNYNRFLVDLVVASARPGDRIVDMGAGIGTFATEVAARGYSVLCMEPDPGQAATIANGGLAVVTSVDAIEDGSVDYVYSLNVLEHIEHDEAALSSWSRKLKPDGRMLVYVPAFQSIYSSMDEKVGHFRRYTCRELESKATAAGLRCESSRYADCLGYLAALAYKWFGSDRGDIDRKAVVIYDRFVFPLSRVCDVACGHVFGKNAVLLARRGASR
jgi:SAM-dependent methyltransferase